MHVVRHKQDIYGIDVLLLDKPLQIIRAVYKKVGQICILIGPVGLTGRTQFLAVASLGSYFSPVNYRKAVYSTG
jgi:hypothetical protein